MNQISIKGLMNYSDSDLSLLCHQIVMVWKVSGCHCSYVQKSRLYLHICFKTLWNKISAFGAFESIQSGYAKQCDITLYWVSSDHQLLRVKGYAISIDRWERAIQMSRKILWQQSGELKSLGQNYRLRCYQVKCRKGSVFWGNRNATRALVRVICQQSWEVSAAPYLTGNQQISVFSSDQWFIVSRQPTEVGLKSAAAHQLQCFRCCVSRPPIRKCHPMMTSYDFRWKTYTLCVWMRTQKGPSPLSLSNISSLDRLWLNFRKHPLIIQFST